MLNGFKESPIELMCINCNFNYKDLMFLIENKAFFEKTYQNTNNTCLHLLCDNEESDYQVIKYFVENKVILIIKINMVLSLFTTHVKKFQTYR